MTFDVVPESSILKPRDPALVDNNDWPDYLLTNVKIANPESGELVSLLQASAENPLQMVGKLARPGDRAQHKNLVNPKLAKSLPANIEVSDIQHFCYGQNDEGEAIMWAAGKAGWFQVEPARAYKEIHKRSCESINTLYFLADFYRELKGRKVKSTPMEAIFEEYTADPSHHCSDEEHAEAVFLRHRDFLLDCMVNGREGINWKNTLIYHWLSRATSETDSASERDSDLQTPRGLDSSDNEQHATRLAGKGKSSLRPRSIKHSLKSMSRRRALDELETDETPTQVAAVPLKRKSTNGRTFKPRKRGEMLDGAQDDDGDSQMLSPSASESSDASPEEQALPLRNGQKVARGGSRDQSVFQIIEEPLPTFEPQGPGDTWHCTFDGCSHIVYDAKKPENRELIKEHYKWHAVEKQAQLDLVFTEERPYLPVNNLIKRIREMAAQQKPAQPQADEGAADDHPTPIARKY